MDDSGNSGYRRRSPATVTVCPDGPLLLRGDVEVLTDDGSVLRRRRSTLALCRCGHSGRAPLCDGSHKVTGFRSGSGRA